MRGATDISSICGASRTSASQITAWTLKISSPVSVGPDLPNDFCKEEGSSQGYEVLNFPLDPQNAGLPGRTVRQLLQKFSDLYLGPVLKARYAELARSKDTHA